MAALRIPQNETTMTVRTGDLASAKGFLKAAQQNTD